MESLQCVLAIDPALSTTGWAIIDYDQQLKKAGKITTDKDLPDSERIHLVVKELYNISNLYPVITIVLEDGYLGINPKTGLQLASLRGAITEIFNWYGYPIKAVQPTVVRNIFGYHGNATKEEIADAVVEFYGSANDIIKNIGPYSNRQNKKKTSDIYDAISIGLAYLMSKQKTEWDKTG